jgi:hypothetical protein
MRYVKYVGLSHRRMITAQDWRSVGITGDTVVWEASNGFAVPLDQFTEDQIRKAIEPDQSFLVTGDDEDFTPVPQRGDMTPAQADQVAENPVDVLALANAGSDVSTGESGASGAPGGDAPTTTGTGSGSGSDTPRGR